LTGAGLARSEPVETRGPPSRLPIIVLTGRSDDVSRKRCEDLGVLYVEKDPNAWQVLETLILKVLRDKAVEAPLPAQAAPAPSAATRVLLVDDDPLVLSFVASDLERYGLKVIKASNGAQGFWLALKEQPAAVITDYDMQQGNGHYLLCRLKSTPATQHIPVVVYTGRPLTVGQQAALQRDLRGRGEAAAFLTKPLDAARLIDELRKHIKFHG
jgi:CheY-like chemotaxis protein